MLNSKYNLRTNFTPLDDTLRYNLHLVDRNDTLYIRSCQNHRYTSASIDDISGSITFEGYWYTPAFRKAIDQMYSGEDIFPFTETYEEPIQAIYQYNRWSPNHIEVVPTKTIPFPYTYRPEDTPAELLMDGKYHDEYIFPLEEGVWADVELLRREVWETEPEPTNEEEPKEESSQSSETSDDDSWYGGGICLTPTYMNRIWFRVLKIHHIDPVANGV